MAKFGVHGKILSIDRQSAFVEERESLLIGLHIGGTIQRKSYETKCHLTSYVYRGYFLEVGTQVLYLIHVSICATLMSCAS